MCIWHVAICLRDACGCLGLLPGCLSAGLCLLHVANLLLDAMTFLIQPPAYVNKLEVVVIAERCKHYFPLQLLL